MMHLSAGWIKSGLRNTSSQTRLELHGAPLQSMQFSQIWYGDCNSVQILDELVIVPCQYKECLDLFLCLGLLALILHNSGPTLPWPCNDMTEIGALILGKLTFPLFYFQASCMQLLKYHGQLLQVIISCITMHDYIINVSSNNFSQ